ncbi:MAG TPA: site-specific tyrosine recombinase/integron integrase [Tissierellaceae bacterium]|nr:site-specific tyrosine recombinase/integron integrase [Tissierellaceae bacterium]
MSETIVGEYKKYLITEKNFSENSLDAYIRDVSKFEEYLQENKINKLIKTDKTIVIRYLMSLHNDGRATSTISRNLASIRCFFQYLLNNNLIKEDPTLNLKSPKTEKKLPVILTEDELNILLSQPDTENFKGSRDKAMLELLYATGLKVSEIISTNIGDVEFELGILKIREGSGNIRVVPIGDLAIKALNHYINNFRSINTKSLNESLFVNFSNKALTRQGVWKIIKTYGKKAGINKVITPHTFRHSFAVHLIENGANIETVKELLGHSDISTTQIYNFATEHEEMREVYKKSHPRA